eukprot:scaffold991_cov279-Chaetoceros_neogracile.AAC.3
MTGEELKVFNNGGLGSDDLLKMCFNSAFAFQLLYTGNILPCMYLPRYKHEPFDDNDKTNTIAFLGIICIF